MDGRRGSSEKGPVLSGRTDYGRQQSPRYDVRTGSKVSAGRVDSRISPPRSPPRGTVNSPSLYEKAAMLTAESKNLMAAMSEQQRTSSPQSSADFASLNGRNTMQGQFERQMLQERSLSDQTRRISFRGEEDSPSSPPRSDGRVSRKSGLAAGSTRGVAMRAEFRTIHQIISFIVSIVDPLYYKVETVCGVALSMVLNKYAGLLGAICFFPAMAIAIPIAIFSLTIGLPIFIPLALIGAFLAIINGILIAGLLAVSPPGRKRIQSHAKPFITALTDTDVGRRLIYDCGPRPSPIAVMQVCVPRSPAAQLVLCLLLDTIGSASYLVPFLGEGADLAWAPMQAAAMAAMFNGASPAAKYIGFLEEILPMTDIIPSATLFWAQCNAATLQKYQQPR